MTRFLVPLFALALLLTLAACDDPTQQQVDQKNNNSQAMTLHQVYPYPKMSQSNELANLTERYKRFGSDPNKVSYVYLLGSTGAIIAEYQVKGKCSSTESQYASPASIDYNSANGGGNVVVPSAQPDGSYGQNEQAIFCFLDDAARTMIEFNTQFIWTDTRLQLDTPPIISIVKDGH